jgi:hypothetical protein
MVVITINRDQLREIAVMLHTIDQKLDVIPFVYVHSSDDGAGLTVGLEEVAFADVHDGVVNIVAFPSIGRHTRMCKHVLL